MPVTVLADTVKDRLDTQAHALHALDLDLRLLRAFAANPAAVPPPGGTAASLHEH
jgi:hypothetical protein